MTDEWYFFFYKTPTYTAITSIIAAIQCKLRSNKAFFDDSTTNITASSRMKKLRKNTHVYQIHKYPRH